MKTVALFSNKGGVGTTQLVYHLAWMFADADIKTIAIDFDPQANLTAIFLNENRLGMLWPNGEHPETVYGAIQPIMHGLGEVSPPHVESITQNLGLIAGDLGLSRFEGTLSDAWSRCHNRDESALRTLSAFYHIVQSGKDWGAELVLIDIGPNLGAINRSALMASDHIALPLASDLSSLQGLKNSGPTLREWRDMWTNIKTKTPHTPSTPPGIMQPIGYIVIQHGIRKTHPINPYQRWMDHIPGVYREVVLSESVDHLPLVINDPYNLASLKHYHSLMPLAIEANKPMFFLKPADGAIGSHLAAVRTCYKDFRNLAYRIASQVGITIS